MIRKKLLFGILALAIVLAAIAVYSLHDYSKTEEGQIGEGTTPLPHGWQLMLRRAFLWEGGESKFVAGPNTPLIDFLEKTLHRVNLQARCVFNEQDIQRMKNSNRIVELGFRFPENVTISQWVEAKDRSYIPANESGYRILRNVHFALFVLEDSLGYGLEGKILIGHRVGGEISYTCWAIGEEDGKEIDKTWIYEIDKILGET